MIDEIKHDQIGATDGDLVNGPVIFFLGWILMIVVGDMLVLRSNFLYSGCSVQFLSVRH